MATWTIQIPRKEYTSLQVGDFICYANTITTANYGVDGSTTPTCYFELGGGGLGTMQKLGALANIINTSTLDDGTETTTLSIQTTVLSTVPPTTSSFIFFLKDDEANVSSLLGYFAKVQFKNDSKEKAELFTISAEINESSK